MRLFFAIDLPKKIKKILNIIIKDLPQNVRPIKVKNMHITLLFLGEVNRKNVPKIISKIKELKYKQFDLEIKDVGTFPPTKFPRIVWIGCENKHLYNLSNKIAKYLEIKNERFKPHITIGRIKAKKYVNLKPFLEKYKEGDFGKFRVKKFYLMESKLSDTGPEYYIVEEFDLG